MTLAVQIPGREPLALRFLLLDVNGTLSDRGELLDGVEAGLAELGDRLEPRLLSADTFGTLTAIAGQLSVAAQIAASAEDKLVVLRELGGANCVAIGNGANDAGMLAEAALGITVIGPEGASATALASADVVCRSIVEALALLREPKVLAATLRR